MGDTKDELSFSDLGAERDGIFFLWCLRLLGRLQDIQSSVMPSITKQHPMTQNNDKSVIDAVVFLITIKKTYHFDTLEDATALTILGDDEVKCSGTRKPNSCKQRGCAMVLPDGLVCATYPETPRARKGKAGLLISISLTTARGHQ